MMLSNVCNFLTSTTYKNLHTFVLLTTSNLIINRYESRVTVRNDESVLSLLYEGMNDTNNGHVNVSTS
jgi:hypothetical protein